MKKDRHYVVRIALNAAKIAALEIFVYLLIFGIRPEYVLGGLLGSLLSIGFFLSLYRNIQRIIDMSPEGAKREMTVNYAIRYVITGFVLVLISFVDFINIYTCIIGLFSIKIVIYLENFYNILAGLKNKNDSF